MRPPRSSLPTPEHYAAFAKHVAAAHSWYKHLPFFSGAEFVVFWAEDAGAGRKVARPRGADFAAGFDIVDDPDGPEFTDERPRLHHSWQTTAEYRERFGRLDYGRRDSPDDPFDRDGGAQGELPLDLPAACRFTLFPYVHETFVEAVLWSVHEEALDELTRGRDHPARERVLRLADESRECDRLFQSLSDAERDWAYAAPDDATPDDAPSPTLRAYLEREAARDATMRTLRDGETAKIRAALAVLEGWLRD